METLFNETEKKELPMYIEVDGENLRSDGISAIIKLWRLSKIEQAMWLAQFLVSEKILSKSYVLKRALIFAYEDGSLEMIERVGRAVEDYDKTAFQWKKNDRWEWEKVYTGEGDMNIFRRTIFWCGRFRKRFETIWKCRKIWDEVYSTKEMEWIAWLHALDLAMEIEKKYKKEYRKKWKIILPRIALDTHSKTWRKLKKEWYKLDTRYSGTGYWNAYMELERQKYGNLDPERRDEELEKMAWKIYKNF